MGSLNKCTIIGNIGKDPEVRFTAGGTAVCNFSVACNEKVKEQEHTEWFRVAVFGKQGEACGTHLKKGQQVYVEGRLQTKEFEKDGQKKTSTELIANNVVFLGSKGIGQKSTDPAPPGPVMDEDVPF